MPKLRSRTPLVPGLTGTARADRRTSTLLARLSAGDIAVLDHVDLDGPTAEALVEARVAAVVNQAPMISGRFPNRGPRILLDAGVPMVDQATGAGGRDLLSALDGRAVRLYGGSVHAGDQVVAEGRELTAEDVAEQLAAARSGLATQMQTLTHSSTEFLRREEALILHGEGVPRLRTRMRGRPVVVVAHGPDVERELRAMRRYLREVRPVVVATGDGLAVARAAGLSPDVVVLDSRVEGLPPAAGLRAARDVVVTEPPGSGRVGGAGSERFERIGVRAVAMQTSASPADAALLLADASGARPLVGAGVRGSVEEFLDSTREGLGSGYVTRLKVGSRLVDATAVPMLYSGQLRARHAYLVLLVGLVAVLAAVATTSVGHQWLLDLRDQLDVVLSDLRGSR